jgi:benzil reductase ((S)-benzoin forming)
MKNVNLYIVSGASKGLGSSLAIDFASTNTFLILISRNQKQLSSVAEECRKRGAVVYTIFKDISDESFRIELVDIFKDIDLPKINKFYLVNNASIIDPISSLVNLNWANQSSLININLTSAIWLSSELLRLSKKYLPEETYIINISSGVSLKPISGWGLYCISKAGINMLTSCIALETELFPNKVYSIAINPGALNTDMQKSIRNADIEESPITSKFKKMHDDGLLKNPEDVSKKIIEIIRKKEFENGSFLDFNLIK